MLDPDYIDQAGDMVASVYGEIEADMLAYLCRLLLDQDIAELGQRGLTAVNLLAQSAAPRLMAFIESHRDEVNEAVRITVEDAISRSDAADVAAVGASQASAATAAASAAAATAPRQVALTARGIAAILERDNVDMAQGALDLWNRCVAEAVTKVNTGAETAERAIHQAVRRMMREGVSTVTYRDPTTGRQTVTNRIDVAVRRHVRTQIAQDGMRRTLDVCGQAGIRLVEVSSHGGARPSHARWQGRVYSLNGEVEIDGVPYKDFYSETGYGRVDGLGGANCRHSFGPWLPGTPRKYEPEPRHPSGLDNDEIYKLTQGQRRRERDIRQTKRELAGAQLIADKDASLANIAEVERLKEKLRGQQAGMRRYIDEANGRGSAPVLQRSPRREWAGDMPKIRKSDASHRTMKEFMDGDGVKRTLKANGITKKLAQSEMRAVMSEKGINTRDFAMLSKTSQRGILRDAVNRITGKIDKLDDLDELDKPDNVPHALRATNPHYKTGGARYKENCQRCIAAYELRRRGYAAEARPRQLVNDRLPYRNDPNGWPHMWRDIREEQMVGTTPEETLASIKSKMADYGDGARAVVSVKWKNSNTGHVFIAEQRDGETWLVDPQSNDMACEWYLSAAEVGYTSLWRIDDKDFTDLATKAVKKPR